VKHQSRYESEPERSVADRSEIHAVHAPHITKGYWDSSIRHLYLLSPNQVLKFFFHSGQAPLGVRSSIHTAAARAGVRVSVKVRGALVYMWKVGTRASTATPPSRPAIMCEVCGKPIPPLPGTSKQFVCGGVEGRKSRCQKVRRRAREHGISISEALARWHS
jgi:hypothetical protein